MKYIISYTLLSFLVLLTSCSSDLNESKSSENFIAEIVTEDVFAEDMLSGDEIIDTIEKSRLSEIEIESLVLMREEEKLARDVYLTLYDIWGQQIFKNIAGSEQTHTDSVKTLLERYDVGDPVTDDTLGVFNSPVMQNLYDTFIEQGKKTLLDALIVGATVEDLDIKDLQDFSKEIDNKDILAVYANLERGSRNHMRSFIKNISRLGGVYVPQYISQEAYDLIISSESERGGNNGGGMGGNRGMGNGENR